MVRRYYRHVVETLTDVREHDLAKRYGLLRTHRGRCCFGCNVRRYRVVVLSVLLLIRITGKAQRVTQARRHGQFRRWCRTSTTTKSVPTFLLRSSSSIRRNLGTFYRTCQFRLTTEKIIMEVCTEFWETENKGRERGLAHVGNHLVFHIR